VTLTFVLGGARSGKSRYALAEAEKACGSADSLVMIATAQALDEEMAERIARHRAERDSRWSTVEAPHDLAGAVAALRARQLAVVDCLTLWLTNRLLAEADIEAEVDALITALRASPAVIFVISNEVGQGIVPDNALARRFRDDAGRMHQALAQAAERVVFVTAGLAQILKG
jgi:adenosylcobinamide kinase/adenosylcobinamide-phosphate guanylyltransferase